MATINQAERDRLLKLLGDPSLVSQTLASGESGDSGSAGGGEVKSGLAKSFRAMMEAGKGQGEQLASTLASRLEGLPSFQRASSTLADLPPSQMGREALLSRVFGGASRTAYSPTANKLDAFILGQAGGNALENMAAKRQAVLRSLGLPETGGVGAQLPPTSGPGGSQRPPDVGGGPTFGQGGGPGFQTPGGGFPVGWGGGTTPLPGGGSPRLPLPRGGPVISPPTSGGDIRNQPIPSPNVRPAPTPAPRPTSGLTPQQAMAFNGGGAFGVLGGALNNLQTPVPLAIMAARATGSPIGMGAPTYSTGGALGGANDPVAMARQRYNTYGLQSLDDYEKGLLGLGGGGAPTGMSPSPSPAIQPMTPYYAAPSPSPVSMPAPVSRSSQPVYTTRPTTGSVSTYGGTNSPSDLNLRIRKLFR